MSLTQMDDFTFKHSGQLDAIYTQFTANQIKALFDSRGIEIRTALNLLITALKSTEGASDIGTSTITDIDGSDIQAMLKSIRDKLKSKTDGTSGADFVNATAISGLNGETVQSLLESLKTYADSLTASDIDATPIASGSGTTVQAQLAWLLSQIAIAATGSIPDGTISEIKLAQALIDKINAALSNTGVLTTLLTIDKSSLVNALNEHLADYTYQLAGGTATAITLTGVVLEDGHPKTFIASADNNGADTTINGKHFYKPGTTTSPTVKSGKAYTVWYDSTGDSGNGCFFIKASAEGDATVADVLAPKKFSNGDDTGLVGTLILIGTAGVGDVKSGKTFYKTDAKTILTGTLVDIDTFTVGDIIIGQSPTPTTSGTDTNYHKTKEIKINRPGNVRVKFTMGATGNDYSYARVYINGVASGTERKLLAGQGSPVYSEDFTGLQTNDLIQIYQKASSINTSYQSQVSNFQICIGNTIPYTTINI